MNIANAETALTRFVADRCGMAVNAEVFQGELPPSTTGAAVRFTAGHAAGENLAEFTAEIVAAFDEPGDARAFADALWRNLPACNVLNLVRIAAAGEIKFAVSGGKYTVTGALSVAFC